MGSFNTENLETSLKRIRNGQDKLAFYVGGISARTDYETPLSERQSWEDISLLKHIREKDAMPVVRKVLWEDRKTYDVYRSGVDISNKNYYVLSGNEVYICLGNNPLNRIDLFGTNNSRQQPVGQDNISSADGYRWRRLYTIISPEHRKFVTDNLMPVLQADDDFNENQTSVPLSTLANNVCGGSGGASGACGLYPKERKYNPVADTYVAKDSLWLGFDIDKCYDCFDLAQLADMNYKFMQGVSSGNLPSTITPLSNVQKIENGQFNPNSNEKIQGALIKDSSANDGEILNLLIDLSNISYEDRKVSVANPSIQFNSDTGDRARGNLITFQDNDGNHVVEGINLDRGGFGYFDLSLSIPSITNASTFTSVIEANIEPLDGLNVSTRKLLNCTQLAFHVEIDTSEVHSLGIDQTVFKTYGILKNPKASSGEIFGSDLNKNESKLQSNVVKLTVDLS